MKETLIKKECQGCGFIRLGKDFVPDWFLCKRCYKEAEEDRKIPIEGQ
jgi:hypothetical protein